MQGCHSGDPGFCAEAPEAGVIKEECRFEEQTPQNGIFFKG
jgi:hypothetical protein